jgi:hypothetical protein
VYYNEELRFDLKITTLTVALDGSSPAAATINWSLQNQSDGVAMSVG